MSPVRPALPAPPRAASCSPSSISATSASTAASSGSAPGCSSSAAPTSRVSPCRRSRCRICGTRPSELRESSSLAVLDGTDIVYVAHAPAKRILSISIDIGTRDVAFATSLGRVLLAGQNDEWLDDYLATVELPAITPRTINTPEQAPQPSCMRIRRQGWALVDQELEDGLRAIAAPIHDEHGNVIAAANLAVHASRWSNDAIRNTLLPRLLQATTAIDRDTNASTPPPRRTVVGRRDGSAA